MSIRPALLLALASPTRSLVRTSSVVLAFLPLLSPARAGEACAPEWSSAFGTAFGPVAPSGPVEVAAVFDDGSGPKLYIGGDFERLGNAQCRDVAVWDGEVWRALGGAYSVVGSQTGFDGRSVRALAVFDDGSGPALYVGGSLSTTQFATPAIGLARWDGSQWSVPGGGVVGNVTALEVHDDGTGPALYVGGVSQAGGQPAAGVARWDGTSWSSVGAAYSATDVLSLASYDAGAGAELYAGGRFTIAAGGPGNRIARWNGASWVGVGGGVSGDVTAHVATLRAHDDGSGAKLVVGGYFDQAGALAVGSIAAWDGASWSALGNGFSGAVRALAEFDGELHAGGYLFAGPTWGFYRWTGADWTGVGGGITASDTIFALCPFDDGAGERLFVGGDYHATGGIGHPRATTWDGAAWGTLGQGHAGHGLPATVGRLRAVDDGTGPSLFAIGSFPAGIREWAGSGWTTPGGGILTNKSIADLVGFDDGTGPALYVGGYFDMVGRVEARGVARWNGSVWSALDVGLTSFGIGGSASAFAIHDDGSGPALYVGGRFDSGGSAGVSLRNVARWDGIAWSDVGGGIDTIYPWVRALCVYDDGTGPALYAAGGNDPSDPFEGIARWDGSTWSSVGGGVGLGGDVMVLAVFDDGAGPKLYAGGSFTEIGGVPAASIARWDGAAWTALPGALVGSPPFGQSVLSLRVFDDGGGPALYVGGQFASAGGVFARGLARFDGSSWSAPGAGVWVNDQLAGGYVAAIEPFDDGADHRADLFVAGSFSLANGFLAQNVTALRTCFELVEAFCFGDGTGSPCPCGNDGLPGHGCRNSATIRGAELSASGVTAPDALVLRSEFKPATALSIFLQGNVELASPALFGDGLRCVGGALKRLYVTNASGGIASAPAAGDPSITERSAALGDPIAPGSTRSYQVYYRDPEPSWCPAPAGSTFNVSNGLRVIW